MRGFLSHRRRPQPAGGAVRLQNALPALLLSLALLAGLLCGSLWLAGAQGQTAKYLSYFAQQYLRRYKAGEFWPAFTVAYLSAFLLLGLVLFLSFSCLGAPLIFCAPLCKGIALGCISAYLYTQWGLRGMAANLLLLFIPELAKVGGLLLLSVRALDASVGLFKLNCVQQAPGAAAKMSRSLRSFVAAASLTLAASLLQAALTAVFGPVFLK